jgi:hypothetical protein
MQMHNRHDRHLEPSLHRWLNQNLGLVTTKHPISSHIDDILQDVLATEHIEISTQMFSALVGLLISMQTPVKPMLIIPLRSIARRVVQAIPQSKIDIESQLTNEPPSLYLVDWETARAQALLEEYNVPLPFELFSTTLEGVYVYYREVRFAREMQNDEEFLREIRAEYYPLGIVAW